MNCFIIQLIFNNEIVISTLIKKTISIYCSSSFVLNNSNLNKNYIFCKWIDSADQTSYNDTYDNAMNDCPNGYQLANASNFKNENSFNPSEFDLENCKEYVFFLKFFQD
jgi:hypothetical protein